MSREPKIFVSHLTIPPRYYLSFCYRELPNNCVKITGKKWDVTEQIKEIVAAMGEDKVSGPSN